jgi:hypothetical protein
MGEGVGRSHKLLLLVTWMKLPFVYMQEAYSVMDLEID